MQPTSEITASSQSSKSPTYVIVLVVLTIIAAILFYPMVLPGLFGDGLVYNFFPLFYDLFPGFGIIVTWVLFLVSVFIAVKLIIKERGLFKIIAAICLIALLAPIEIFFFYGLLFVLACFGKSC